MNMLETVKVVFYFALTVLAISLLPIVYQIYHIVTNMRRVSDRMEALTDASRWWQLLKKFVDWRKI